MKKSDPKAGESKKDILNSRPEGVLPTPLEPASPEARGYPADPKIPPDKDRENPEANEPPSDDDTPPA